MLTDVTDATVGGHSRREDDVSLLTRLVVGALKDGLAELRKDDETRISRITTALQGEISAFREGEEVRTARLEKAIASWKPTTTKTDPTTNFWTVYKRVADEYDNDMVSKYVGDLDTSLLFAGLFSAITSAFIVQIIPQLQPNPADLTNALLLRILEQNTSFGGADPLTPISNIPAGVVRAQPILFASLSITLFVAFISVLGKQWIHHYTQPTTWGNIVDRGKERQAKLVGLQKWGLHLIMESLPVMLQCALLIFGVALVVYLWDLVVSIAEVVLAVTSLGFASYACIAVAATIWSDCPFQTPLSDLFLRILQLTKEFTTLARVRLRRAVTSLLQAEWVRLTNSSDRPFRAFPSGEDTSNSNSIATLSNPILWRNDPLFNSPIPKDEVSSAGFWLLENSTDFSAASAVAAVFPEFQCPSHYRSTTALIRLRDTYEECLRAPEFKESTRLTALQSAAAYYVLYHTQLIWNASKSLEAELWNLPRDLPPDLFLHLRGNDWGGNDVFEHLLRIKDRSEPAMSARFLSYIAPYWFCGDSDSTIESRMSRLPTLFKLIKVLEKSRALNLATLADCVLCVGAAIDLPLHPEDLIRVDKSGYFVRTFEVVVDHIHGLVLNPGDRLHNTKMALEILLILAKKTTLTFVGAAWMNKLLENAARGDMDDDMFIRFLRLNSRRKGEDPTVDIGMSLDPDHLHVRGGETDSQSLKGIVPSGTHTLEHTLSIKIFRNVRACSEHEGGWQDEAVYGGLMAMKDIPRLGSYLPNGDFLETLSEAMGKGKPFQVRKAAYDVILVAQDGWLKSEGLRQTLERLDFPTRLHSVVIATGDLGHRRSFLKMMDTLSEDRYWHSYLRGSMSIWLPFCQEGPDHVLHILTNVGELSRREYDGFVPSPLEKFLEKLVEDEWARVPGRVAKDLTADRLRPLAEVTRRFKELLFTESERRAVLSVVERVIPSLERRRGGGYEGPGEDIRGIVNDLLENLRVPM